LATIGEYSNKLPKVAVEQLRRQNGPFRGLQLAATVFSLAVKPFCISHTTRRNQRFTLQAAPMK
jgi:hypothetical protein